MMLLFAAIYLLAWGSGCGVALAVLVYALDTFVHQVNPALAPQTVFISAALVCAVPLSALVSGYLLDSFLLGSVRGRSFRMLALPLAAALFFGSGMFTQYLEAGTDLFLRADSVSSVVFFSSVISSVFFCGGVVAMCLMALCLSVELPLRWLASAGRLHMPIAYEGIRLILVVLAFSAVANLIVGLYERELWPTALEQMVGG